MIKLLVNISFCFCCLLSVIAGPAAGNVAFCVGADGHVALEAATEAGCSDARGLRDPHDFVSSGSTDEHCGPCTDLQFGRSHSDLARTATSLSTSVAKIAALPDAGYFRHPAQTRRTASFVPAPVMPPEVELILPIQI